MTILNFKGFMKKYNLKDNTVNDLELKRVYIDHMYPRVSKIHSNKGFVNIDNGYQGGTHWCRFIIKDTNSYYFDSFGYQPDKFLLKQLPKPITYHNYKIRDINSKLCGSYCLYFFYLIERMNYYDTILEMYFHDFKYCRIMYLVTVQINLKTELRLHYSNKDHI